MTDGPTTSGKTATASPDDSRLEMAVLASVISDRFLLLKALDEGLDATLFRSAPGQLLASTLSGLRDEGMQGTDLLMLRGKLEQRGQLSPPVVAYLDALSRIPPVAPERVASYLDFLKERAGREVIGRLAEEMELFTRSGQGGRTSVTDFSGSCIERLLKLQQSRVRKRLAPLNESVREMISDSKNQPASAKPLMGYSLAPFVRLEDALSGLRRGFYYGLAGAPRRGKTNFALHLATQVASNHQIPVLFYSWEQTRRVLSARLVGRESGMNPTELLKGGPGGDAASLDPLARGLAGVQKYGRSFFLLEGSRQDTVARIRATAYNVMHDLRSNAVAIFLDYLQKVPLDSPIADARARLDEISTGLADLSLELDCPVVVISAIDKEGCRLDDEPAAGTELDELLDRPRPTMHHCTGGGDIEYDLDVAMVLSKDWAATQQLAELMQTQTRAGQEGVPKIDLLNLHIDKNRDAPQEVSQAIQYAFFVYENRFVEVDFKRDAERQADFRGFAKAQEVFEFLVAQGGLHVPAPTMSR